MRWLTLALFVGLVGYVCVNAGGDQVRITCRKGYVSTTAPRRNITRTPDGWVVDVPGLPAIVAADCWER